MPIKKKKVIIIGAGFGGLSASCYLAKAGFDVEVYEKNDQVGGRAITMSKKGFLFDMGPSWYMMPDVFDDFFEHFGKKVSDYYKLVKLDPSYRVFTENEKTDVSTEGSHIQNISPTDARGLERLLKKTKQEYDKVRRDVLDRPMINPRDILTKTAIASLLTPELVGSYHSRIKKYIKDPEMQKILEFMVVFMGGSPKNVPAMYSLLAHVDMGMGIWYPIGGFGVIANSMRSIAEELGVTFHLSSPVDEILIKRNQAVGIVTKKHTESADIVLANADYHHVDTKLVKSNKSNSINWSNKTLSPSGLLLYLGIKKKVPNLLHHNLFLDTDWDNHFSEVFDKKIWSKDPLFYVCVPSKTDKLVAPKGYENIFVLAPMAGIKQPSDKIVEKTIDKIIDRIERKIGTKIRESIVVKEWRAQQYFEDTFNAYSGNAFGLAHTLNQSAIFRPSIRHKKIPNLYFTGQYTNPGTGVPMVVLSGKVSASTIIKAVES